MPAKVKNLYKAKSITELKNYANVQLNNNNNPKLLCRSADRLFVEASQYFSDGDEEMAYILFMRYFEVITKIKNCADYKRDKEYFDKLLGGSKPFAVMDNLEKINKSLTKRYDALQQSKQVAEKELREENLKIIENTEPKNEVVVKPEEVSSAPSQSLTSMKLYQLIEDATSLLIVDVRSKDDFVESHLKHSSCINIPADVLTPGTTAAAVDRNLPRESADGWSKRHLVDFVVFLDWSSTFKTMQKESPIHCLMEAVCKWDQSTILKSSPFVLEGGYEDWLLRFPSITTNADISVPNFKLKNEIELLDKIAYPDLDEQQPANQPEMERNSTIIPITNQPKPNIDRTKKPLSINSQIHSSVPNDQTLPAVHKVRRATVANSTGGKQSLEKKEDDQSERKIPVVDRSKKPSKEKEASLAERSLEVARERLEQETKFEALRLQREHEAEQGMREELQRQEEELCAKIERLEKERITSEENLRLVRQENETMKKELENFQRIKEEEQVHEQSMHAMEEKKKEMDLEVERLRQIRKQNEIKAKEQNLTVQESETKENEYVVALSDAPTKTRSLSRSHSSPDIARLLEEEEEKKPVFDRKAKPLEPNRHLKPIFDPSNVPLRNFNPVYSSQGHTETGLRNLGNTCFMNSVIQCLYNTIPLTLYLLLDYKKHINREAKLGTGGEIAEELAAVVQSLYQRVYRSIAPTDFKTTVSRHLPICVGYEQQDAHEFLVVLLEKVHADLNRARCIQPPKVPANDRAFWQWHTTQNSSIITELFEGLLKSTLRCLACSAESSSYEVFSCLSLPISSVNRCSLKGCIQKFLEMEKMCGEASWDCPTCKQKREAEKFMAICRLPVILIIHLKRFSYEGMWRRKLQTSVDFPLHDLDMGPYLISQSSNKTKYSLYGVVNHYGTLEGGHYISYCKNSNSDKWFKYDDHDVAEIAHSRVQTSAAYLLFYTSVNFS